MRLLDYLFPPREDEVLVRNADHAAFTARMQPYTVYKTDPAATVLLRYHDPVVRAALHEAKYHGSRAAFTLLAEVLAQYLETFTDNSVHLIPVPLGRARLRARGFNQVEEVARRACMRSKQHIDVSLITRTRETTSQVSLPREAREGNMRGAFGATQQLPAHEPGDIQYIVLDDVLTTGATLQAALDVLKAAGVQHISALALAH